MIAPHPDGVPAYLIELKRWVLWHIETRVNRKTGEVNETKPPISYYTSKTCDVPTRAHGQASPTCRTRSARVVRGTASVSRSVKSLSATKS